MPKRNSIAKAIGIGAVASCFWGSVPVDAQEVEPDAPERDYAGCYSIAADALFPSLDPLPGREDRYQLPDTVNLTLQLRTLGWSLGGPGDWREKGYFLGVDPALVAPTALHRYHAWRLSDTHLLIVWRSPVPARGSIGIALSLEDRGGEWRGIATLTFRERTEEAGVVLRSVPCPGLEYWRVQRTRIVKRWTPLPEVELEIGRPQPLPVPRVDTLSFFRSPQPRRSEGAALSNTGLDLTR